MSGAQVRRPLGTKINFTIVWPLARVESNGVLTFLLASFRYPTKNLIKKKSRYIYICTYICGYVSSIFVRRKNIYVLCCIWCVVQHSITITTNHGQCCSSRSNAFLHIKHIKRTCRRGFLDRNQCSIWTGFLIWFSRFFVVVFI